MPHTTETGGSSTTGTLPAPRGMSLARRIGELAEQYGVKPDDFIIGKGERIILSLRGMEAVCRAVGVEPPPAKRFYANADRPENWAPINRAGSFRGEIDAFRNERQAQPRTVDEAIRHMHLALELYEHAQEAHVEAAELFYDECGEEDVLREACISAVMGKAGLSTEGHDASISPDVGGLSATSRSAAEKIVDTTPAMRSFLARKHELASRKAIAEKELSVARRRHSSALATVNALALVPFTVGEPTTRETFDIISRPKLEEIVGTAFTGTLNAQRSPDAAAGDSERAA